MDNVTKSFALILVGIMVISCMSILTVESVFAQTSQNMPKPSVPEFTAQFVDSSPEITIKNQPLPLMATVSNISLYYGFRFKDHNATISDWYDAPIWYFFGYSSYGTYYKASTSDYTVVSFPLGNYPLKYVLNSGRIDLQVMALIGNEIPSTSQNGTVYVFDGVISDWSNTQYITIPASSTSPTPSSTSPMPTINTGQHTDPFPTSLLVIALVIIAVVIASVLLFGRQRKIA